MLSREHELTMQLSDDECRLLREMLGAGDEPCSVGLYLGTKQDANGNEVFGLYAWDTGYPEEGATLIHEVGGTRPAPMRADAVRMSDLERLVQANRRLTISYEYNHGYAFNPHQTVHGSAWSWMCPGDLRRSLDQFAHAFAKRHPERFRRTQA